MKYLGIDLGLKRIGLAISEGQLASPLSVMDVKNRKEAISKLSDFIKQENFDRVVIGLPEGKMGQIVLRFVKAMEQEGIKMETTDETLSSQDAVMEMVKLNIKKKKRQVNDNYSAAIILQNYLDKI